MKKLLVFALALSAACAHARPPVVTPPPPPVVQPAAPQALAVHNEDGRFVDSAGHEWKWKGATDLLLFKRFLDHEDIDPILDQRQGAGANLVRVLAMAENLAHFNPVEYATGSAWYWEGLEQFVDKLAARGLYVEVTVFADATAFQKADRSAFPGIMPALDVQLAHWGGFHRIVNRPNVFIELVNEEGHPGQQLNTAAFPHLDGGTAMQSHGSGLSDAHPVEPFWDFVTYHARRDPPPDARGATNYDPDEFEATFPKDRAWIADEGIKTLDARYAALAGRHANIHNGGTFHSQSGVMSVLWSDAELAAARAFYGEIK